MNLTLQDVIDRHGLEDVKTQFALMRVFHNQYNPDTDGDLKEYIVGRLMTYHQNLND